MILFHFLNASHDVVAVASALPALTGEDQKALESIRSTVGAMPQGCNFEDNQDRLIRDLVLCSTNKTKKTDEEVGAQYNQSLLREYFDRYLQYFQGTDQDEEALQGILGDCSVAENKVARQAVSRLYRLYAMGALSQAAPQPRVLDILKAGFDRWKETKVVSNDEHRDLLRFMDKDQTIRPDDIAILEGVFNVNVVDLIKELIPTGQAAIEPQQQHQHQREDEYRVSKAPPHPFSHYSEGKEEEFIQNESNWLRASESLRMAELPQDFVGRVASRAIDKVMPPANKELLEIMLGGADNLKGLIHDVSSLVTVDNARILYNIFLCIHALKHHYETSEDMIKVIFHVSGDGDREQWRSCLATLFTGTKYSDVASVFHFAKSMLNDGEQNINPFKMDEDKSKVVLENLAAYGNAPYAIKEWRRMFSNITSIPIRSLFNLPAAINRPGGAITIDLKGYQVFYDALALNAREFLTLPSNQIALRGIYDKTVKRFAEAAMLTLADAAFYMAITKAHKEGDQTLRDWYQYLSSVEPESVTTTLALIALVEQHDMEKARSYLLEGLKLIENRVATKLNQEKDVKPTLRAFLIQKILELKNKLPVVLEEKLREGEKLNTAWIAARNAAIAAREIRDKARKTADEKWLLEYENKRDRGSNDV